MTNTRLILRLLAGVLLLSWIVLVWIWLSPRKPVSFIHQSDPLCLQDCSQFRQHFNRGLSW
jgi:hypothetical protein